MTTKFLILSKCTYRDRNHLERVVNFFPSREMILHGQNFYKNFIPNYFSPYMYILIELK